MKVCEVCGARFRGQPVACPLDGGALRAIPDPLLGRTIAGRYVIEEKIGAGGMGTVYRARHEVVGRDVAVKFLSPELAFEPTNRTRFLREARAANRINHEHIIDITDYGETEDGLVYLVMEFLVGRPLNAVVAEGPMSLPVVMEVTVQIAQALARAHELDVVHRDIKPDNLYMVAGYDNVFAKILDFGLAHMKGELRVTATGTVFGTPEYMSPEQARGAPITPATDLYSYGVVLFEMLTGELPFQGATTDLIFKHLREPPRAPSFHNPNIPPEIDQLVLRLLEKDAEDRLYDAAELVDIAKGWLHDHHDELPTRARVAPPAERPSSIPAPRGKDEPPSTTELIKRWSDRVEVFRKLANRAHPVVEPPVWLVRSIDELHDEVETLRKIEERLRDRVTLASFQEEEVRTARLRIGRALDELMADESRVGRTIAAVEARAVEAQARISQVNGPLFAAWKAMPVATDEEELTIEAVSALREAGVLAAIRVDAARTLFDAESELTSYRREHSDLQFQIGQLKGRLGVETAGAEHELDALRSEATSLDGELHGRLDRVVKAAEPVVRHFMEFPHLRDVVRSVAHRT